jgi:hypothetical protein
MLLKVYINLKNLVKQEGRVLLIVLALKKKEILNIYEAMHIYNMPYTTLQCCLKGYIF